MLNWLSTGLDQVIRTMPLAINSSLETFMTVKLSVRSLERGQIVSENISYRECFSSCARVKKVIESNPYKVEKRFVQKSEIQMPDMCSCCGDAP